MSGRYLAGIARTKRKEVMNLLNLNIIQSGFFKQARFLLSSPERVAPGVFISETGTITKEILPVKVGYITAVKNKMAWINLHALKLGMKDKDGKLMDEQVVLITERNYVPLDPFGKLTNEERKNLTPLQTIARLRHAEKRQNIGEGSNEDAHNRMLRLVTESSFILMGLIVVVTWLSSCGGGK